MAMLPCFVKKSLMRSRSLMLVPKIEANALMLSSKFFGTKNSKDKLSKEQLKNRRLLKISHSSANLLHEEVSNTAIYQDSVSNSSGFPEGVRTYPRTEAENPLEKDAKRLLSDKESLMIAEISKLNHNLGQLQLYPSQPQFESATVHVKGKEFKLGEVSQVAFRSSNLVSFVVYEKSTVPAVIKALRLLNPNFNPQEDSKGLLKLTLAKPTAEARQRLFKQTKEFGEQAKARIREHNRKLRDQTKQFSDFIRSRAREEAALLTKVKSADIDKLLKQKLQELGS